MHSSNYYHDKPLFGLDFGHSNIKVMQLEMQKSKRPKVLGYGITEYPSEAVVNGVIVDNKPIAEALYKLFTGKLIGAIKSKRVACTITNTRTFSRPMNLPPMSDSEIKNAVQLEAEQYIPIPPSNLYLDYDIARRSEQGIELLMVAAPKNIVDSYIKLMESVGLEPVAFEPTMNASARVFSMTDPSHDQPTILIDFGSIAVDLAVYDQTMFVNSTIVGGSEDISVLIAKALNIQKNEAYRLKNNYGIAVSDKQADIIRAIQPILANLLREIQKIIRYYDERKGAGQRKIGQIVTFGGGANMPGLTAYLSNQLKMPVKTLEPWLKIDFGDLPMPGDIERSIYTTVAGEAMLDPKGIFA